MEKNFFEKRFQRVASFWMRWSKIFFVGMFVAMCVGGALLWRYTLVSFVWDANQRQVYIQSQLHRISFHQKDFDETIALFENRNRVFQTPPQEHRDIFSSSSNQAESK